MSTDKLDPSLSVSQISQPEAQCKPLPQLESPKKKRCFCQCSNCLRLEGKITRGVLRLHKCDIEGCGRLFTKTSHLQYHIRRHKGDQPYVCSFCEKKFVRHDELTRHRRIHTGEKPYQCRDCEKGFTRRDHLQKHLRSKDHLKAVGQDNIEKTFACDICKKNFLCKDYYIKHQQSKSHKSKSSLQAFKASQGFTSVDEGSGEIKQMIGQPLLVHTDEKNNTLEEITDVENSNSSYIIEINSDYC